MKIEISRRRFLQGSVALSVVAAGATTSLAQKDKNAFGDIPAYGITKTSKNDIEISGSTINTGSA